MSVNVRSLATWLLLVGLVAGPVVAIVAEISRADQLRDIPPEELALVVVPERFETDGLVVGQANLLWGEGEMVVAPNWSGLVTAIDLSSGDALQTGDTPLEIDGVRRMAFESPAPFHRPLSINSSGSDVVVFQELLIAQGAAEIEASGKLDYATSKAAVAWAEEVLGVPPVRPSRFVFDPAWIIWIPSPQLDIDSIEEISVGMPAPPAGSAIFRTGSHIVEASLVQVDENSLEPVQEGDWIFEYAGGEVPVVNGVLDFAKLDSDVTSTDLNILGTVRRKEPLSLVALPPSAVRSAGAGTYCVWLETDDGYESQRVQLSAGSPGQTAVLDDLPTGRSVLVNPEAILADGATCE